MAKKIPVSSVTPQSKTEEVSQEQKGRTRRLVADIATAGSVVGAARDVYLLAKAAKAGKETISAVSAAEKAKMAAAKNEKPYPIKHKGTQGVDSDTTLKVKGQPKQTPETGTKVIFQKVVDPSASKTATAREYRSEKRVQEVVKKVEDEKNRLKGNVVRSVPQAGAAVVADVSTQHNNTRHRDYTKKVN